MTEVIKFEFFTPGKQPPDNVLELVAAGINKETETMVPVTPETLWLSPLSLVLSIRGVPAAYGRYKRPDEQATPVISQTTSGDTTILGGKFRQIGSLWVPNDFRGKELGKHVIKRLTCARTAEDWVPYALCRTGSSLRRFLDCGYELAVATYPGLDRPGRACAVYTQGRVPA
ncbi:hypothetical protein IPL85_01705 [Candidatus Saccharibacteria bacterium]|nr:MAG: hypothetical protein IPL85_01705 [Candidatus Saccharibacteria bacterium]